MTGLTLAGRIFRTSSIEELAAEITQSHGLFVRMADIWSLAGYPSADAARKAATRQQMPFPLVTLPGRRGHFVRSVDLAAWAFEAIYGDRTPLVAESNLNRHLANKEEHC